MFGERWKSHGAKSGLYGEIQILNCLHNGSRNLTPSVVILQQNVPLVLPNSS